MEAFETIGSRVVAAIEKCGIRQAATGEIDRLEVYTGPNIRAFLVLLDLDPNDWRQLLEANQFGSVLDLEIGQTQLAIPSSLIR